MNAPPKRRRRRRRSWCRPRRARGPRGAPTRVTALAPTRSARAARAKGPSLSRPSPAAAIPPPPARTCGVAGTQGRAARALRLHASRAGEKAALSHQPRDAAFPRGRGKARLVDVPRAARQQHERRERRERQQRGDERRHHRGDDRASQEPRGQRAAHTKAPRGGKRGARLPGDARIELHRLRRAVQLQPINMFERLHFRPENRRSMLNCNRPDMCGSMSRAAAASRCAPAGFGIASAVAP